MSEATGEREDRSLMRRLPLPMPRSLALMWLNIALSLVVGAIGFGMGFAEGVAAQLVILYTIVSVAVFLWLLNAITIAFENRFGAPPRVAGAEEEELTEQESWWRKNRVMVLSMTLLLVVYLIVTATVPPSARSPT